MGGPGGHRSFRRRQPRHTRGHRLDSRGHDRRHGPSRGCRTWRTRVRPMGEQHRRRAPPGHGRPAREDERARRRVGEPDHGRGRRDHPVLALRADRRHQHGARLLHEHDGGLPVRRGPPRHDGPGHRAQGARRCRRRHHPVECSVVHHDAEVRPDARIRLDHGVEARTGYAAVRVPLRRDRPRGRRARRRAQRGSRRP